MSRHSWVACSPVKPLEQALPDRPDIVVDDNGDTNQLIVLLDLDDPEVTRMITGSPEVFETRARAEEAVVGALNNGYSSARAYFSNATEGWHLIWQNRLDEEARRFLDDDAPQERLQQYIVLSYPGVDEARAAMAELRLRRGARHVEIDQAMSFSWAPNDPYFPIQQSSAGYYQWGMHAMSFPHAWDRTRGHGHVGVIDTGFLNDVPPQDLQQNHRSQFSFAVTGVPVSRRYHGTHVMGIVTATANNGIGVAGGCPTCSGAMATLLPSKASLTVALDGMIARGMQVINMSLGAAGYDCVFYDTVCTAIASGDSRDVLLVAAAGNFDNTQPDFPANHPSVLAVGGAENTNPSNPTPFNWVRWYYGSYDGHVYASSYPGISGVMGPTRSIVSTVPVGAEYIPDPPTPCSDLLPVDESGVNSDGYGSCTGTSMATPHVSALAGILRSINPRLSRTAIQNTIRASGTHAGAPSAQLGHGLPRADLAVDSAIAQTPNRLTPLFSQFSWGRRDFLFTTVPQMASAATWGTLQPANYTGISYRYGSAGGFAINGYPSYPGAYSDPFDDYSPKAAAWIFTTALNPKNPSVPLVPLYRLSWKCGDPTPYPPVICGTVPGHMDTTYTADPNGVTTFQSWGYKLDGIEGYIYPKTVPQPPGTVRLMRKYNSDRDDHAIFPETMTSYFTSLGYTENSGSDWLGYVYPNTNGNVPVIL